MTRSSNHLFKSPFKSVESGIKTNNVKIVFRALFVIRHRVTLYLFTITAICSFYLQGMTYYHALTKHAIGRFSLEIRWISFIPYFGSTLTFLYFYSYFYTAYAAHYIRLLYTDLDPYPRHFDSTCSRRQVVYQNIKTRSLFGAGIFVLVVAW